MSQQTRHLYVFGPYRLAVAERLLLRAGDVVPLTPKAVDLLIMLVENRGRLVTKKELMNAVWPDSFVEEANLSYNVSLIRKALGEGESGRRYIDTVPKRGYRFVAEVLDRVESDAEATAADLQSRQSGRRTWITRGAVGSLVILLVAVWFLGVRRPEIKEDQAPVKPAFTKLTEQAGLEHFPSLSPDGKSFVYSARTAGNWDIWWQRVGGANAVNLTPDSSADDTQPALSPDGERIAFRSDRNGGGIFVMGATGESVRRLSDFGFNPVWMPDGKEILCATNGIDNPASRHLGASQLWAINVGNGAKRLISKGDAVQPHCSPGGLRIAYWSLSSGGQPDIWTITATGGEAVRVTDDAFIDWNPVWSPDGRYLFFASDRKGSMNFWRVRIDERSGKVLGPPEAVTAPSGYCQHLTVSAEGSRLAFVQTFRKTGLQRVEFDFQSGVVEDEPVWIIQSARQAAQPDVSPDGAWLAFSSPGDREDLFVVRSDGAGLRQLTDDVHKERNPRWSPDGSRISFFSDRSGRYEIWTISPEGSGAQQITHTSGPAVNNPGVWSPDGKRIAFGVAGGTTYIADAGKHWNEQSAFAIPAIGESKSFFVAWSWSPDGHSLAGWSQPADGQPAPGIVVYSLRSGKLETLTDFGDRPVWLQDSKRLLFVGQGKLFLVDSRSKRVQEVLSVAPDQAGVFDLTPDNRHIYFVRVTSESDIGLLSFD